MRRPTLIVFTVMVAAALSSSAFAQSSLHKLVLARGATGILYAAEQVGLDQGFFKKEGIDLQILAARGSAGTAAVLAGQADIAPSLAQFIPAAEKGAPVVAFASSFQQFGILWVLSNKAIEQSGVTANAPLADRIRALKGLRIGISRSGSTVDVLTRILVKSVGMNPDQDLRLVPVGGGASMLAALQRGEIDGYTFTSPFVEEAQARGLGKVWINLESGEFAPLSGAPHVIYYTTRSKLKAKREDFVHFTRAIALALAYIHQHPDSAKQIMEKYLGNMSPALITTAWNEAYPAFPKTPAVNPTGFDHAVKALAGANSTLSYDQLVDPTIVQVAMSGLK